MSTTPSIAIVDYGMANLRSVQKAFEHVGVAARIISTPEDVRSVDRLVLPGVGAFKDAVATLRAKGLADPIVAHIENGKPFLGICLGLQMLFDVGYEDGEHRGLGVLRGKCVRFDVDETLGLKVPHMGWNRVHQSAAHPLWDGIVQDDFFYFVHSYHVVPAKPALETGLTFHGPGFTSAVARDNIFATQFHPEKSAASGLRLYENFIHWQP